MSKTKTSKSNVKRARKISPSADPVKKINDVVSTVLSDDKAEEKKGYTGGYGKTRYDSPNAYAEMKTKRTGSKYNVLKAAMEAFMSKGKKKFAIDMLEIGLSYVDSRLPKHILDHTEYKGVYKAIYEPSKDIKQVPKSDKSGLVGTMTMGLVRCDFVKVA